MKLLLPLLLLSPAALASDWTVTPGQSIQTFIDIASPGDRVLLQPGTYLQRIDFGGKDIEVIGVRGAAQTTLDGGFNGPVVRFSGGESSSARLAGLTVTRGSYVAGLGGGGVQCLGGSTPSIEDCVVRGNTGKFGGGISGSPSLRRTSIVSNTSSLTHGGGIYGAPQMQHCVVASNRASSADGGGIYVVNGDATLEDCVIIENGAVFANSSGGGIYVDSSATAEVRRCVIAANFATGGAFAGLGGGAYAESAGSLIESCTVVDNSLSGSSTQGAGLFGAFTVRNSIVRGNNGGPNISGAAQVTFSDVGGGYTGFGNVDVDPLFVDETNRDWHLDHGSPLIDAGDPMLLDPDLSPSDIGAFHFRTLYTVANTLATSWEDPSWPEVSATLGGKQVLQVLGDGSNSGQFFWTLGTTSGTSPGIHLMGVNVPLNYDAYLIRTGRQPNTGTLSNSQGTLDADGRTQTTFRLAPNPNATSAGLQLHHATLLGSSSPLEPVIVTQPEPLTLVH